MNVAASPRARLAIASFIIHDANECSLPMRARLGIPKVSLSFVPSLTDGLVGYYVDRLFGELTGSKGSGRFRSQAAFALRLPP
jgi:hypothetical protein